MKQIIKIYLFLCGVWLLAACARDEVPVQHEQEEPDIMVELPVVSPGMHRNGKSFLTRSEKEDNEGIIVDNKIRVIQFDGVEATSKVIRNVLVTVKADNTVTFPLAHVTSAQCRVYMVANATPVAKARVTTLAFFEQQLLNYAPVSVVTVSEGLSMSAYQDLTMADVTTANPTFTLRAMVAKLMLRCAVDETARPEFKTDMTYKLRNIANGSTFGMTTNYANPWTPVGITWSDKTLATVPVADAYEITLYVPENIVGHNSVVTDWKDRYVANAPRNATYFEVVNKSNDDIVTMATALFPGDQADPKDFNVRRNYAYTLEANILGVDETDLRMTVTGDFLYASETDTWKDAIKVDDEFGTGS